MSDEAAVVLILGMAFAVAIALFVVAARPLRRRRPCARCGHPAVRHLSSAAASRKGAPLSYGCRDCLCDLYRGERA